jgi:hypothetical protein
VDQQREWKRSAPAMQVASHVSEEDKPTGVASDATNSNTCSIYKSHADMLRVKRQRNQTSTNIIITTNIQVKIESTKVGTCSSQCHAIHVA